jgi:hypothetical protein
MPSAPLLLWPWHRVCWRELSDTNRCRRALDRQAQRARRQAERGLAILRGEAPNAAHYLVLDACRNTFVAASEVGQGSGPYDGATARNHYQAQGRCVVSSH